MVTNKFSILKLQNLLDSDSYSSLIPTSLRSALSQLGSRNFQLEQDTAVVTVREQYFVVNSTFLDLETPLSVRLCILYYSSLIVIPTSTLSQLSARATFSFLDVETPQSVRLCIL